MSKLLVPREQVEKALVEGHASSSDLDDYFFESIAQYSEHLRDFQRSIVGVNRLLETKVEIMDRQCFLRLLYVDVICALESYLSGRFISSIKADPILFRRFVETTPEFQAQKVPLSDIFKAKDEIEQRVKMHLAEFVWHRLDRVRPMFQDTLGVRFPSNMEDLFKAILWRHDFVHRNGRTMNGEDHILEEHDIKNLVKAVESFVSYIELFQPKVEENVSVLAAPTLGNDAISRRETRTRQ
jgi:hypothetical protein